MISPSTLLVASMLVIPVAGAVAQGGNPDNVGGTSGSQIARPHYPPGTERNPALTTGAMAKGTPGVPADKNPNVPGATGHTVVKGTQSSVAGDRKGTIKKKTGP